MCSSFPGALWVAPYSLLSVLLLADMHQGLSLCSTVTVQAGCDQQVMQPFMCASVLPRCCCGMHIAQRVLVSQAPDSVVPSTMSANNVHMNSGHTL